ncbi:MAG: hypothetical protein MK135_00350 [Polyangiaceae bacterium]|nr:hypothetical protein [Polyangiaceae bacterium]
MAEEAAAKVLALRKDNSQLEPLKHSAREYIRDGVYYNREAPIPPQCYTRTEGKHNPCYVCHQTYSDKNRPNFAYDGALQGSYEFSEIGLTNSWRNLFLDKSEALAALSDQTVDAYVDEDNYSPLVEWMKSDAWQGEVLALQGLEDGAAAFDEAGLAKDGSRWVAFNYKPFPSTFWPTNGSTDDTMIRLAEKFSSKDGEYCQDVYFTNLALLELAFSEQELTTVRPLSELIVGVDFNCDGLLNKEVTPIRARKSYVGDANDVAVARMLYPEGTAFLHTVRYLDVAADGTITPSRRMKEVRYMKKQRFLSEAQLRSLYYAEHKEKHFEALPKHRSMGVRGTSNTLGWLLLGFIEDEKGVLRRQHPEEEFACTGCHKAIGSTLDQTFSFPRKVVGADGWGYLDLKKQKDVPSHGEEQGEFLTYLERVGGGDEFRQNQEMQRKFFREDGSVDREAVMRVADLYEMLVPSAQRARQLNKAYLSLVRSQEFIFGRDAVLAPPKNVLLKVDNVDEPLRDEHRYEYDIRLNWHQAIAKRGK